MNEMDHIDRKQLIVAFIAVILLTGLFSYSYHNKNLTPKTEPVAVIEELKPNPFENLEIQAGAVYIFDINNKKPLYAVNAETQLPLTSLTKVMTAVIAREIAPKNTIVTIQPEAIREEGDSGLLAGERWNLSDILDLTLVASSNDGAKAVASAISAFGFIELAKSTTTNTVISQEDFFISKMNQKAKEIGMVQTFFLNESGLDNSDYLSGSYGSAKDMAVLFAYVLKNYPDVFPATSQAKIKVNSLDNIVHTAKNTNEAVGRIPSLVASKTGFTDLANGNLVVAFEAGPMRPIIVAVLGSGIDTRFEDVEKLVWASIKSLQ